MDEPLTQPIVDERPSENNDVQKLKDLVKRLERQNEHLRGRTSRLGGSISKHSITAKSYRSESNEFDDDNISEPNIEELDTVDLDKLNFNSSDDEDTKNAPTSWLYVSPTQKKSLSRSTNEQVEEWMSSELENPSTPHLASAKRNIIAKLQRFVPDWSYDNDGSFAEYSDNEDGFADDNIKLPRGRLSYPMLRRRQTKVKYSEQNKSYSNTTPKKTVNYPTYTKRNQRNSFDTFDGNEVDYDNTSGTPQSNESFSENDDDVINPPHQMMHHSLPIPSMTSQFDLIPNTLKTRGESPNRRPFTPNSYAARNRSIERKSPAVVESSENSRPSSRKSVGSGGRKTPVKFSAARGSTSTISSTSGKSRMSSAKPVIGRPALPKPSASRNSRSLQKPRTASRMKKSATAPPNGKLSTKGSALTVPQDLTFERSSTFTISTPKNDENSGNIPARPNTSHTNDVTKSPTSSPHPYNLPRPSTTSTSGMMARHRSLRPPTVRKSLLKPPKSNSLRPSAPKQDSTIWADDDEVY